MGMEGSRREEREREREEEERESAGGDDAEVREGRGWSTTNIQSDQIHKER